MREAFAQTRSGHVFGSSGSAQIDRMLQEGSSLVETLRSTHRISAFDLACLGSAEHSGHLPHAFRTLADRHEKEVRWTRTLLSKLAYPAFVFHVGAFVFPLPEVFLKGGSYLLSALGFLAWFYGIATAVLLGYGALLRSPWAGAFFAIPLVGRPHRQLAMATFFGAMHRLYGAGIPLGRCFENAAQTVSNRWLRERLDRAVPSLRAGHSLLVAAGAAGIFEGRELQFLETGERSGTLEETFRNLEGLLRESGEAGMGQLVAGFGFFAYLIILCVIGFKIIQSYAGLFSSFVPD